MQRKEEIKKIIKTAFGLFIFSFGEYLTILGNVGLTPWDSLSMAITNFVPLTFGQVHVGSAIIIMFIDLAMKEKIGIGTILDALLVGTFVDMWTAVLPFSEVSSKPLGYCLLIVGFFGMALGQAVYMAGGLSCGPRDTLLVGIGKRLKKLPIGLVDIIIKVSLVIIAFLMKGPIGIGTLLSMVGMGTCMQLVFGLLKFEPRDVVHEGIVETIKNLK